MALDLDVEKFRQLGTSDPEEAARLWKTWLSNPRGRSEGARYRKALELAVGVSAAAVGHFLSPVLSHKLSEETRRRLETVSLALGYPPKLRTTGPPPVRRGMRRIALVADLGSVPSPRYHLEVLRRIVAEGARFNCSVALHDVSDQAAEPGEVFARIVRSTQPHGVVWFRLTPDRAALNCLQEFSPFVPAVVVHGARLSYPPPVIGHVVPHQAPIRRLVEAWARRVGASSQPRTGAGGPRPPVAVIVRMLREPTRFEFPEIPGTRVSIRNERIDLIEQGLQDAGFALKRVRVRDYSASQAFRAFRKFPDAEAYVCLSDEIAVGLRQLLLAAGRFVEPNILGFDASDLARAHRLPSIDQGLGDVGRAVFVTFARFFRAQGGPGASWPGFEEVEVETNLTERA